MKNYLIVTSHWSNSILVYNATTSINNNSGNTTSNNDTTNDSGRGGFGLLYEYGQKQNTVNVNGLISPVYIINGVIKSIPLIGKVLGGEKGEGVFGVSYKVQGDSSNPIVLVNPLSILTPGVFRKIFNIEENGNR